MPMTGSSRDTCNALLRTVYEPRMREHFASRFVLLQEFNRETETMAEGERISVALHVAGGGGPSVNKTGLIPPASHQKTRRAYFNYVFLTDRLSFDADLERTTSSKAAAERKILDFETKGLIRTGKRALNHLFYGDGTSSLAAVVSASDSTTLVVDHLRGLPNNARVDILITSDGTVGGGVVGASISVTRASKTITLQDGATLANWSDVNGNASTYTIYRHSSRNAGLYGLQAWVSGSNPPSGVDNLGGIDRDLAVNDFYKGIVHSNDGTPREITFPMIQDILDDIEEEAAGETRLLLCGNRVWNWIANNINADKRFTSEKMKLRGWMEAISFGSVTRAIVKDPGCPPTMMFVLDPSLWTIKQENDGEFMSADGSILHRVPDYVRYEASHWRKLQLICEKPIAQGAITDLTTALAEP